MGALTPISHENMVFRWQRGVVILFNVSSADEKDAAYRARLTHMSFRLCYFSGLVSAYNELEDSLSGDIEGIICTYR